MTLEAKPFLSYLFKVSAQWDENGATAGGEPMSIHLDFDRKLFAKDHSVKVKVVLSQLFKESKVAQSD